MLTGKYTQVGDKLYNATQLKLSHHGTFLHRDYSAHFFRWSFVRRHLKKDARILDVGCGQELPLFTILYLYQLGKLRPASYTGVDLNVISKRPAPTNIEMKILDHFNILTDSGQLTDAGYDVVTCLEVIEHMDHADGQKLLRILRDKLAPGGHLYLSTPVFNGSAAKNHLHEYTVAELSTDLALAGLSIERRFGTFANLAAIKKSSMATFASSLANYFDDDAVSCICAPCLNPDLARNNLWVLTRV